MASTTQSSQPVQNGGARPGAGRPIGSRSVRVVMREKLIAAYVDALGGTDRVGPIRMQDVERAVDLTMLAREMRERVRLGSAKVSDLTSLEGHADRAIRRLGLPAPNAAAPSASIIHDHIAKRAAERASEIRTQAGEAD